MFHSDDTIPANEESTLRKYAQLGLLRRKTPPIVCKCRLERRGRGLNVDERNEDAIGACLVW